MSSSLTTVGAVLKGIVSGKSIQTLERPVQGNEFGILKVSAVTWGEFRPAENKALPADYDPKDCPRPMDGDILISRANTRDLVGAPVMVKGNHPQLLLSDKLLKLIPDEAVVDAGYLVRVLRSPSASMHFYKCAGGSSGSMTNITQADIRTAPIYLPSLPEQRRIAAILDQAETLRTQRRSALAQLDRLTQAIFLDMFGDPVANDRGWPTASLRDFVAGFESGKSLVADDEDDSGSIYRVLKISAVTSLEYKPEQSKAVPTDYRPPQSHIVRAGDLLFSRANTSELIGATAFVDSTPDHLLLPDKLWRFVWHQPSNVAPFYVMHLFRQPKFRQEIGQRASGTSGSMKNISQEKVLSIRVGLPPLPLQQTFTIRIEAIEALKASHRSALSALDALFAALQQRAFQGAL